MVIRKRKFTIGITVRLRIIWTVKKIGPTWTRIFFFERMDWDCCNHVYVLFKRTRFNIDYCSPPALFARTLQLCRTLPKISLR